MSGSSEDDKKYVTLDDILDLANISLPIVNEHIHEMCKEAGEVEETPKGSVSSATMDGLALNLIHGAFTLLLAQQLLGNHLELTEDALQKATGFMNLAANRVMVKIPGSNTTLDHLDEKPDVVH